MSMDPLDKTKTDFLIKDLPGADKERGEAIVSVLREVLSSPEAKQPCIDDERTNRIVGEGSKASSALRFCENPEDDPSEWGATSPGAGPVDRRCEEIFLNRRSATKTG